MADYTKWDSLVQGFRKGSPKIAAAFDEAKVHSIRQDNALTALAAASSSDIPSPPGIVFSKYAAPAGSGGSDANPGTIGSPYLTVRKLFENTNAGQFGALRGGTYGSVSTQHYLTAHSGTAGNPITIMGFPGETALIQGNIYVETTADYVTLSHLTVDGSNNLYNSPNCGAGQTLAHSINGDNVILEYNEFYQSVSPKGIMIYTGAGTNLIIRYNKLHDFGACYDFDHGVYIGHHTGADVHHNWFWNNGNGWGAQFYPEAVNCSVHHNVFDRMGCGVIFSDNGSATCTGNQFHHNVVVNSTGMPWTGGTISPAMVYGSAPQPATNNTAATNNSYGQPTGGQTNVTVSGTITTDPQFVDYVAHNYAIQAGSPIASWGMWDGT